MNQIGNQQMLREINKSLLLNYIYEQGPISRVELARKTRLSPTTVSVLMEDAIQEGLVRETGTAGSGVGRRMTLLDIHAEGGCVLGVDLSNAPARCVLLNLRGKVLAAERLEPLFGEDTIRIELPKLIRSFLSNQSAQLSTIRWMGISIPGRIDEKRENIVNSTYLGLQNFPLRTLLFEEFGIPMHLVNDLDAAGFAERFNGAAKGLQTIVYILIDYGVGAGLVLNNQIYRGRNERAGRIQSFAPYSTKYLSKRLLESYPDHFSDMDPTHIIQRFVELGIGGVEPLASELNGIIQGIAAYCGDVLQLLSPEQLILSGWIAQNEAFFSKLAEEIQKSEAALVPTPVKAPQWKEYGAAIGAATIGLHRMFKSRTMS
ncbi:ROK family transcriptional regulator [Paenibacillus lutrae]|uniref:ROK family protein n=1 Tax=Paenibacillus lutrae TaxID=2078573 RepID=A0A7X3FJM9_9BACL|nr:ROK family transcriptional regulator [Paenibacillus lutrae]MVP00870.1 ROK family protein [Paenibacillus lutrae]